MLPTLWPGDVLTIEAAKSEELQLGNVVLFIRENRFFVHRVVGLTDKTVTTRGDAMPKGDGVLRDEELLAGHLEDVPPGDRSGAQGGQVRAGAGLGECEAGQRFAAGQACSGIPAPTAPSPTLPRAQGRES